MHRMALCLALALSLALFDYMRKSRSRGFVLSLSGGADSSCCAVAVAEMVRRGVDSLGVTGFVTKARMFSLKDAEQLRTGNLLSLPTAPTLDAWFKAWGSACTGVQCEGLKPFFWNSMAMIVPAVAISTTLGALKTWDAVNLEIDVLARYLKRMQSLAATR